MFVFSVKNKKKKDRGQKNEEFLILFISFCHGLTACWWETIWVPCWENDLGSVCSANVIDE